MIVSKIQTEKTKQIQKRVFICWKWWTHERVRRNFTATRILKFRETSLRRGIFEFLKTYTAMRKWKSNRMGEALIFNRKKTLKKYFNKWSSEYRARIVETQKDLSTSNLRRIHLLRAGFEGFRQNLTKKM